MTTYLLIDHNNETCAPSNFKAAQAATQMGQELVAVVVGYNCNAVADGAAKIEGIKKVLVADGEQLAHQPAEAVAPVLLDILEKGDALIAASSTVTRNILPRIAAKLDVMQVYDVVEVLGPKSFVRPIYAGNALSHVETNDDVVIATIRTTAFQGVGEQSPVKST
jgi:Electron transfer flavoprotein, alpha subunit